MNFCIVLKYVWGSHVDRVVDIFHLSIAEMSGLGASLAVWSYLPVYSSFYFYISSMNTGVNFIRKTNNDLPLTISLSSVSTKAMKSIFSYLKKCWIVLNTLYKQNSIRITQAEVFADACKLWKHILNFFYYKPEKINEIYMPVQNCIFYGIVLSFLFLWCEIFALFSHRKK